MQVYSADATAEGIWRANVELASVLHGFDPHGHPINGMNLSSKDLTGANFRGKDARLVQLNGATLQGAHFERADLRGAELSYADLSTAELSNADLSGTHLEGSRFDRASVEGVKSLEGAISTLATCWPAGFLELKIAKGLQAAIWDDGVGHTEKGTGHEYPCPEKYRRP